MTLEQAREFCLSLPDTTESEPFGPGIMVYKIGGRMYAVLPILLDDPNPPRITVKGEPAYHEYLRDRYPGRVQGAYHFSKTHWSMVDLEGGVPAAGIEHMIIRSYLMIRAALPAKVRTTLPTAPPLPPWAELDELEGIV